MAQVRRVGGLAILVAAAVTFQGCQTTDGGSQGLQLSGNEGDDRCAAHSSELRNANSFFEQSILGGAVIGAGTGAILGALFGGGRGAATGAIAGGLTGATVGYLKAKQQENEDRQALLGSVLKDVRKETAEINRALIAFKGARECRLAVASDIKARYRRGEIDRATAESRLGRERDLFHQDVETAKAVGARINARQAEFGKATVELAQDSSQAKDYIKVAKTRSLSAGGPGMSPQVVTAKTNINVRTAPDVSSSRLAVLESGKSADFVGYSADRSWVKIGLADGRQGYVAAAFVTITAKEGASKSLVTALPPNADTQTKTAATYYEGVEKRVEFERLSTTAEKEEQTSFSLS